MANIAEFEKAFYAKLKEDYPDRDLSMVKLRYDSNGEISGISKNTNLDEPLFSDIKRLAVGLFQNFRE